MHGAKQVIPTAYVVNINYVGIGPSHRPGLRDHEPIAAVLEAWRSFNNHWTANVKCVLTAKIGSKAVIRNAPAGLAFSACVGRTCRFLFLLGALTDLFFIGLFFFSLFVYLVFLNLFVLVFFFFFFFVFVDLFIFLLLLAVLRLIVRLRTLFVLWMVVLRIHRCGNSQD